MEKYIRVSDDIGNIVEIPTDFDGTISLTTLVSQFNGASGLKYQGPSGFWRALRIEDKKIYPPRDVSDWENIQYNVVQLKENKRKIDDCNDEDAMKLRKKTLPKKCNDLIVLGLNPNTTPESLKKAFLSYGDVILAEVKKDIKSGKSKGYGFIRFSSYESQLKVLMKKINIDGRWCAVKLPDSKGGNAAVSGSKIFVGGVDYTMTAADLKTFFESTFHTTVVDVFFVPAKNYAFVTFLDWDTAHSLYGESFEIGGKSVFCRPAEPLSDTYVHNSPVSRDYEASALENSLGGGRKGTAGRGCAPARKQQQKQKAPPLKSPCADLKFDVSSVSPKDPRIIERPPGVGLTGTRQILKRETGGIYGANSSKGSIPPPSIMTEFVPFRGGTHTSPLSRDTDSIWGIPAAPLGSGSYLNHQLDFHSTSKFAQNCFAAANASKNTEFQDLGFKDYIDSNNIMANDDTLAKRIGRMIKGNRFENHIDNINPNADLILDLRGVDEKFHAETCLSPSSDPAYRGSDRNAFYNNSCHVRRKNLAAGSGDNNYSPHLLQNSNHQLKGTKLRHPLLASVTCHSRLRKKTASPTCVVSPKLGNSINNLAISGEGTRATTDIFKDPSSLVTINSLSLVGDVNEASSSKLLNPSSAILDLLLPEQGIAYRQNLEPHLDYQQLIETAAPKVEQSIASAVNQFSTAPTNDHDDYASVPQTQSFRLHQERPQSPDTTTDVGDVDHDIVGESGEGTVVHLIQDSDDDVGLATLRTVSLTCTATRDTRRINKSYDEEDRFNLTSVINATKSLIRDTQLRPSMAAGAAILIFSGHAPASKKIKVNEPTALPPLTVPFEYAQEHDERADYPWLRPLKSFRTSGATLKGRSKSFTVQDLKRTASVIGATVGVNEQNGKMAPRCLGSSATSSLECVPVCEKFNLRSRGSTLGALVRRSSDDFGLAVSVGISRLRNESSGSESDVVSHDNQDRLIRSLSIDDCFRFI